MVLQYILRRIKKGNTAHIEALISGLTKWRTARSFIKKRGKGFFKLLYKSVFTKLPIQSHTIIYESFLGRNYSDNPKAIYQYLKAHFPGKFQHVWVMDADKKDQVPKSRDTRVVTRFGLRYMYYLATAKYQVFNMRQPKWFIKRPETTFLETWHGTPLKRLVFDMENVASANPHYKKIFYHQSRQWDYLISANSFSTTVFKHAFMFPEDKIIETGYPRNDVLITNNCPEKIMQIKKKLGLPLDKRVILYAPTWRDDQYYRAGKYKFTLNLDIQRLKKELGDNYVLILRTHYFIANQIDTATFGNFVFDESRYNDISELYLVSDVLITDYSSVFFDFATLKRPILFFAYDYKKYADVLRGFYLDMEHELPGPVLKTNDDILAALKDITGIEKKYRDAYKAFADQFTSLEAGKSTARVVNQVFGKD